jgi:hypothetical protein
LLWTDKEGEVHGDSANDAPEAAEEADPYPAVRFGG